MRGELLSGWLKDPAAEHAYMRCVRGTDPLVVANRRVFIEKTPRVFDPVGNGWVYGPKGSGELCGLDPKSRAWADMQAREFGYDMSITFYMIPYRADWKQKKEQYELVTFGTSIDKCEIMYQDMNGLLTVKLFRNHWVDDCEDDNGEEIPGHFEDNVCNMFKDKKSAMKYAIDCLREDVKTIEEDIKVRETLLAQEP
jgi:hypothetical protein